MKFSHLKNKIISAFNSAKQDYSHVENALDKLAMKLVTWRLVTLVLFVGVILCFIHNYTG